MANVTRTLGSSELRVPVCCLGTMTFGEQCTENQSFDILDYSLSRGVNFIDCAELYPVPARKETTGATEVIIGRWLALRQNREKVIIASKVHGGMFSADLDRSYIVANRFEPPKDDGTQPRLDAAQIRSACEASLRRLQTTYLDLYQIHWPARYVPLWGARQYHPSMERTAEPSFDEQVLALGDLIKEGKIRYWGLSNETSLGVLKFTEAANRLGVPPPISIQNDFSVVFRNFEEELAETCAPSNCNVGLLAYGPLAGGTLTGKYLEGKDEHSSRHNQFPKFQPRYFSDLTKAAAAEYVAIAKHKGITPTQLALAWAKSRWYMGSVIIGATTVEQCKENIDAFDVDLDEETLKAIDKAHLRIRNPNQVD